MMELTRAHLARIDQLDPQVNSYITLTADSALRSAQDAEDALQTGRALGPLHGIPLALKDLYETRGVRNTIGSKFLAGYVPEADAAGDFLTVRFHPRGIAHRLANRRPPLG